MTAPTMPADCRVETLADWLADLPLNDDSEFDFPAMARAVRALVEAKVREAIRATRADAEADCDCDSSGFGTAQVEWYLSDDTIVSRVLGGAS